MVLRQVGQRFAAGWEGEGRGLLFVFFYFSNTGGGLFGPGEGRCQRLKCIFGEPESGSLTGERSGGGGGGGNEWWRGLR